MIADSRTAQDLRTSLRPLGHRWFFQRHYLPYRSIPCVQQVSGSESVLKFLVGGLAPSPQSKKPQLGTHKFVRQQKAETYSTITGNYAVLQERLRAGPGLAFSTTELMLTGSL